jgi:hypothetical protein
VSPLSIEAAGAKWGTAQFTDARATRRRLYHQKRQEILTFRVTELVNAKLNRALRLLLWRCGRGPHRWCGPGVFLLVVCRRAYLAAPVGVTAITHENYVNPMIPWTTVFELCRSVLSRPCPAAKLRHYRNIVDGASESSCNCGILSSAPVSAFDDIRYNTIQEIRVIAPPRRQHIHSTVDSALRRTLARQAHCTLAESSLRPRAASDSESSSSSSERLGESLSCPLPVAPACESGCD